MSEIATSIRLTPAQRRHLERIAAYQHEAAQSPLKSAFRDAGWFHTKSEAKLVELGLIECWEETRPLGGGGAIGQCSVTWSFARLTDAGWAWMKEAGYGRSK